MGEPQPIRSRLGGSATERRSDQLTPLARHLSRRTRNRYLGHLQQQQLTTAPEIAALSNADSAFKKLDVNSDETLSKAELRKGFQMAGHNVDDESFQMLWELADQNQDEKVSLQEFKQLCKLVATLHEVAVLRVETGISHGGAAASPPEQRQSRTGGSWTSPGSLAGGWASELSRELSARTRRNLEAKMIKAGLVLSPDAKRIGSPQESFSKLDTNGKHALSRSELRNSFVANGCAVDDDTLEELWAIADRNCDNEVSREEYHQLFQLALTWEEKAAQQAKLLAKTAAKNERKKRREEERAKKRAEKLRR